MDCGYTRVPMAQMGWNAKYFEGLHISFLNIAFDIFLQFSKKLVFFSVNTDTNVG